MAMGIAYISNELSKYGISSSGNIQSDLAEIKKAKIAKGESTLEIDNFTAMVQQKAREHKPEKIGKNGHRPQNEPQWFALLKTLGIQPQGSKEADFTAIESKLTQMKSMTLSEDQKANLQALQAQYEQYKNANS